MFIFANNMQQSLSGLRALILTEAVLVPSGPRCGVRAAGAGLAPPGPGRVQFRHTGPDPGRRARQRLHSETRPNILLASTL